MDTLANRALPAPTLWTDYRMARQEADLIRAQLDGMDYDHPQRWPLLQLWMQHISRIDLLFARAYYAETGRCVYDYNPQEDAA